MSRTPQGHSVIVIFYRPCRDAFRHFETSTAPSSALCVTVVALWLIHHLSGLFKKKRTPAFCQHDVNRVGFSEQKNEGVKFVFGVERRETWKTEVTFLEWFNIKSLWDRHKNHPPFLYFFFLDKNRTYFSVTLPSSERKTKWSVNWLTCDAYLRLYRFSPDALM